MAARSTLVSARDARVPAPLLFLRDKLLSDKRVRRMTYLPESHLVVTLIDSAPDDRLRDSIIELESEAERRWTADLEPATFQVFNLRDYEPKWARERLLEKYHGQELIPLR